MKKQKPLAKKSTTQTKNWLTSPKARFLTIITVIAIVGAGYFTYRSFAATSAATWTAADFDAPARTLNDDNNKAGVRYIAFTASTQYYSAKTRQQISSTGDYRVCLTARASAPQKVVRTTISWGFGQGAVRDIDVVQTQNFLKKCHPEAIHLTTGSSLQAGVQAKSDPLNMYITAVHVEKVGAASDPSK